MSLLFPRTVPPTCDKKWFPRSELSKASLEPCANLFLSNQVRGAQQGQGAAGAGAGAGPERKNEKEGKTELGLLEEEEKVRHITLWKSYGP